MEISEQLLKCFKTHNQRRLLKILYDYHMTHVDLVAVTGMNEGLIGQIIKQFLQAGLIVKQKIEGEKMTIYLRWFLSRGDLEIHDVLHSRVIELDNELRAMNRIRKRSGLEPINAKIARKSLKRGHTTTNPLPNYPTDFIKQVFKLFKFNDPNFDRDIKFIEDSKEQMRAISYLNFTKETGD
jgi:hypothetical protein